MSDGNKQQEIKEAIIKTIVFFDIFSYPLSATELWRFLGAKCTLEELEEVLLRLDQAFVNREGAFYFLNTKEENVKIRSRRYNYSNRKMKRAINISKIFKYIPWIKMIGIGNVMGTNNLKDGSDIDFFIVCEKNRAWISRFISTVITKVLLLRPRVNDVRDKICLSFYISEEFLALKPLFIEEDNDPYFAYWLANLIPIYDCDGSYKKLLSENDWVNSYFPNWKAIDVSSEHKIGKSPGFFYKEIVNLFLGGLDPFLRRLQLKILPNDLRLAMNKDTRVVISSKILKLHVKDRRRTYLEMYQDNLEKYKNI